MALDKFKEFVAILPPEHFTKLQTNLKVFADVLRKGPEASDKAALETAQANIDAVLKVYENDPKYAPACTEFKDYVTPLGEKIKGSIMNKAMAQAASLFGGKPAQPTDFSTEIAAAAEIAAVENKPNEEAKKLADEKAKAAAAAPAPAPAATAQNNAAPPPRESMKDRLNNWIQDIMEVIGFVLSLFGGGTKQGAPQQKADNAIPDSGTPSTTDNTIPDTEKAKAAAAAVTPPAMTPASTTPEPSAPAGAKPGQTAVQK